MRETLSKRPRTTVKTIAKIAKTKVADKRVRSQSPLAPKSKTISAPKSSLQNKGQKTALKTAKPKTAATKSAKSAQKTAIAKKTVAKSAKAVGKKAAQLKPVAKRNESVIKAKPAKTKTIQPAKTKVEKPKVLAKAINAKVAKVVVKTPAKSAKSAKIAAPAKFATQAQPKSQAKVQPGKASPKTKHKIAAPINVAPPPAPELPRRSHTSSALRAFEHAVRVFNRRQFEDAKPMFENLLVKYSNEVEIIARAQMYIQVCIQKLAHSHNAPRNAEELYDRGVYALNIGDFSQAKTFFEKALRLKPDEAHLLYSLAATHAQTGTLDQALDYLKRTIQIQPRYRTQALNDSDFSGLRENKQFLEMLGLSSPFDLLPSRR